MSTEKVYEKPELVCWFFFGCPGLQRNSSLLSIRLRMPDTEGYPLAKTRRRPMGLIRAQSAFTLPMAAWEAIIILSLPDQFDCHYSEAEAAVVEWLDVRGIELKEAPLPREVLSFALGVAEK
jgi:hypothetical protein